MSESSSAPTIAFFDLDGTLLTINSGAYWVKNERKAGRLSRWQFLEGVMYLIAYKFDVLDMEHALGKALMTVKGEEERVIAERTERWYHEQIAQYVSDQAYQALAWHRERGHKLVLLTTSSPYEAATVKAHLDLDHVLHSRYEVVDGRFTGKPLKPFCYGDGKVHYAEQYAAPLGADLSQAYFYTDSNSDLPMLLRVGHPRVVNPDFRLKREARRRGWEIQRWG